MLSTKSIRFRISLWYMAILLATLTIFSGLISHVYKDLLLQQVDSQLLYKAEAIADSINTYWDAERLEAIKDGQPYQVYTIRNNQNFVTIAQKWLTDRPEPQQLRDPHLPNLLIQIFDNKGRHIVSSKTYSGLIMLPLDTQASIERGNWFYNTVSLKSEGRPTLRMRQLTIGVEERGRLAYIVQISCTLDRVSLETKNLQWLLLLFIPVIVLLTGIMGAFLAGRTLKPVRLMTQTIQNMDPGDLSTTIPIPGTHDELQQLAETFNKLLSEASHAFKTQTQFISDASHELRTPLTIIKGELDVLLKKSRSAQDYREAIISTLEEIDTLSHIIESLLVLARLDNPEIQMKMNAINISPILNQTVKRLQLLANSKKISIVANTTGDYIVRGEPTYIERVFSNIIDNAIKYSPPHSNIQIMIEPVETNIVVSIKDEGPGISEENQLRMFDRFFQADNSRHGMGFGLGLSMSKRIMELHRGSITVKTNLEEGSTFFLHFPRFD